MTRPPKRKKFIDGVPQTINDADPMASLRAKLKTADLEIQNYITAVETENLKLHRQIGKLQADNVSLKNRIKVIIEQNKKQKGQTLAEITSDIVTRFQKIKHRTPQKKMNKRLIAFLSATNVFFLLGVPGIFLYQYQSRPLIDVLLRFWKGLQNIASIGLLTLFLFLWWLFERIFLKWTDRFAKKTLIGVNVYE